MRASCAAILLSLLSTPALAADGFVVARAGSLVVDLVEIGELRSLESRSVTAPFEWRNALQIIELAPEGSVAAAGDTLVRFDAAFLDREVAEVENRIARDEAELRRIRAAQGSQRLTLQNAIQRARFSVEQGELAQEKLGFESESTRREAELTLRKAEVSLEEARAKLTAQHTLDSLEVARAELKVANGRAQLDKEREQLVAMTLTAPMDGLVVYGEMGWGDQRRKIRFGDEVPAGAPVVELPNLDRMEVDFQIHEVDRRRVVPGTRAEVTLAADPSRTFHATVTDVAKLALPPSQDSPVRRFGVRAALDGPDPLLKPGLTATVRLRIEVLEGTLLPLAAIFERDGQPVVVPRSGSVRSVQVLARDDFHAVVDGIEPGGEYSTVPPADVQPLGYAAYHRRRSASAPEGTAP